MNGFVVTLHVIVSVLLIGGVLLQPGAKGGGLSATFGGGGANSAFGAQGSAPFFSKVTYWLAAAFLSTALIIEILIVKDNRSVFDKSLTTKPASAATPQTPVPTAPTSAAPATSTAPATPAAPTPAPASTPATPPPSTKP